MSRLTVYEADLPDRPARCDTRDGDAMARKLGGIGARFERWRHRVVAPDASADTILTAYAPELRRLRAEGGYAAADVIRLRGDRVDSGARDRFVAEHSHIGDEVRFFVAGAGLFFLHARGQVYRVECEMGDLLVIPAGVAHWFDTGPSPRITAIRMATTSSGMVARYSGSDIAESFPLFGKDPVPHGIVEPTVC